MVDEPTEEIRVRMPRGKELFGVIESIMGASRFRVRCQDDKIRVCRIPGRLRKMLWIHEGDIVLIEPWEIQTDTNGDIIWKYTTTQAGWLKRKNLIKFF